MSELNYQLLVEAANSIRQTLNTKPRSQKIGFQISPGGILNAYREGDVNFKEACGHIEWLINPPNSEDSGTQPTASNTGSPKLPTYEEVWKHVAGVCAVAPHKSGCKVTYDFICSQLRAGA